MLCYLSYKHLRATINKLPPYPNAPARKVCEQSSAGFRRQYVSQGWCSHYVLPPWQKVRALKSMTCRCF